MNEEKNLIKMLAEAIDSGRGAAFVTVISVDGSTPREAGAKMLVYADGSIEGTVGGGAIEALAIKRALECLRKGEGGKVVFDLKPKGNTGMICMGKMELFIDVYKNPFKVLILGGGHVGVKIAEACRLAGYPYAVADDRKEFANGERFPGAMGIINEAPHKAVAAAGVDADTYAVIVTRGHALDRECLEALLRSRAAYIGMIGSASKVAEIFRVLEKKKLYPLKDRRVHSPIGLNLGGKAPGEIAVSVLAEIIKVHYKRDGAHMRDKHGK
jgi:xanthine dehydrogenase accessory factor